MQGAWEASFDLFKDLSVWKKHPTRFKGDCYYKELLNWNDADSEIVAFKIDRPTRTLLPAIDHQVWGPF